MTDRNREKAELLLHLRQQTTLLGRPPKKIDLLAAGTFMRVYRCFGGLKPALRELGLKSHYEARRERVMQCAAIVLEFHRAGLTVPQIARKTKISKDYIAMMLREQGVRLSFGSENIFTAKILQGRDTHQPGIGITVSGRNKKFSFSLRASALNVTANFYRVFPRLTGVVYPVIGFIRSNCFDEAQINWVTNYHRPLCEEPACVKENVIALQLRALRDDYRGNRLQEGYLTKEHKH